MKRVEIGKENGKMGVLGIGRVVEGVVEEGMKEVVSGMYEGELWKRR